MDNEQKEVKRLVKTSSDGKMIQEGIQTVILENQMPENPHC
ncbi:MAG: hypothetical protein ACLRWM_04625 [Streptococcus sp.]